YPDVFHYLLGRRALPDGRLGVALNAIRALGHVCDGNGDQLLALAWQRAVLKDRLAELLKGRVDLGGERAAPLGQRLARSRIKGLGHGASFPLYVTGDGSPADGRLARSRRWPAGTQISAGEVPVDKVLDDRGRVVRPAILVVEIVG